MQNEQFIRSSFIKENKVLEKTLRPNFLKDFVGQEKIKNRLQISIEAAKQRKEQLPHTLFYGPPGLGKTTLANILSKSLEVNLTTTSGPSVEKPGDLAGILTNLKERDILFIDEIHRLPKNVEEYLYSAMEDFAIDLLIDSGPCARSVKMKLNKFTLVGATTRTGLLSEPLRSRFAFTHRLDYYEPEELKKIILRSSTILNLKIDEKAALEIALRSRGTPRIANHLLGWIRDYTQIHSNSYADETSAKKALEILNIDNLGLDELDKKILNLIINHYNGGPVGLKTISVALSEDTSTIEDVYEPYLIMKGFLKRTLRGREVTKLAYEHLNISEK